MAPKPVAATCRRVELRFWSRWRPCLAGLVAALALGAARVAAAPAPDEQLPSDEAPRGAAAPANASVVLDRLDGEIARLRATVDQLSSVERAHPRPPEPVGGDPAGWRTSEVLIALGAALVAGFAAGTALQRHRARRARSLRF